MAQIPKIVDLTRSFTVIDPAQLPEILAYTPQEDSPEKSLPVLAYEGYNFLPTPLGYKSYFGLNSQLDISSLTSPCEVVLVFQLANYQNILIALCDDGIWYSLPNTTGATWTHSITETPPLVGETLSWSFCIIENTLYMYRQGSTSVHKLSNTDFTIASPGLGIAAAFGYLSLGVAAPITGLGTAASPWSVTTEDFYLACHASPNPCTAYITIHYATVPPNTPIGYIDVYDDGWTWVSTTEIIVDPSGNMTFTTPLSARGFIDIWSNTGGDTFTVTAYAVDTVTLLDTKVETDTDVKGILLMGHVGGTGDGTIGSPYIVPSGSPVAFDLYVNPGTYIIFTATGTGTLTLLPQNGTVIPIPVDGLPHTYHTLTGGHMVVTPAVGVATSILYQNTGTADL